MVTQKRIEWLHVVAKKEIRIMDSNILNGQMNGALFYASSSLLALGGCFALLTNQEKIFNVLMVAFHHETTTMSAPIELKIMALMGLFAYAFFKFSWSFRLFAYSSVLIGSIPELPKKETPGDHNVLLKKIDKTSSQAAHVNIQAAKHFDRGQRAIFASLPLLSWFVGDDAMIVVSIMTALAMLRRQFFSQSVYILK